MKVIYVISILIIYLEMLYKVIILKSGSAIDILYTVLFSAQTILIINLICNVFIRIHIMLKGEPYQWKKLSKS